MHRKFWLTIAAVVMVTLATVGTWVLADPQIVPMDGQNGHAKPPTMNVSSNDKSSTSDPGPVGAASSDLVDVGSANISSDKPNPIDRDATVGDPKFSCTCSVAFKLLQSENYGDEPVPDGTEIDITPLGPDQPSPDPHFQIKGKFPGAGYYKITLSGGVIYTDTDGNIYLGQTPATTTATTTAPDPLYVAKASASFSPNPVTTGVTLDGSLNIKTGVTATVAPADQAANVDFTTGSECDMNSDKDVKKSGIVTFTVTGSATYTPNGSLPNGDNKITAKIGGASIGSAGVLNVVPASVGKPHEQGEFATTAQNVLLDRNSVPPIFGDVPDGKKYAVTIAFVTLNVIVWDQFGRPVSTIYNGAKVSEKDKNPINQFLIDSTYWDAVGPTLAQNGLVDSTSDWPNQTPSLPLEPPYGFDSQTISVQVGGWSLNPGVAGRRFTWTSANTRSVIIDIIWP